MQSHFGALRDAKFLSLQFSRYTHTHTTTHTHACLTTTLYHVLISVVAISR